MGVFDRILRRLRGEPERQDTPPGLFTARSPGVSTDRGDATGAPPAEEDLWDRPEPSPTPAVVGPVEPDVTEPVVIEPGVLEPEAVESESGAAEVAAPVDPGAELAAIEELAPPAAEPETPVAPVWDEDAWDEAGRTTELPQQVAGGPRSDVGVPEAAPVEDAPADDAPVEDAVAPAGSTADQPLFGAYGTAPEPPEAEEPAPDPVPPLFDPPEVATEPEPDEVAPEVAAYLEPEPAAAPEPEPEPEPEPQALVVETHPEVFDPAPAEAAAPPAAADPAPVPAEPVADEPQAGAGSDAGDGPTAAERTVRVHDERLDKRPGPIRMTPSEAIRLAQDGPRGTRRPDRPEA